MLDKFTLQELTKYSVRTFDYIPQDARSDVREVYYAVLNLIYQASSGALDLNIDSQDDMDECRKTVIYIP